MELIDGGMREEEAVKKAQSCPAAKRLFAHREKLAEEAAKKKAAKKAAEAAGDFDVEGAAGDGEACNGTSATAANCIRVCARWLVICGGALCV